MWDNSSGERTRDRQPWPCRSSTRTWPSGCAPGWARSSRSCCATRAQRGRPSSPRPPRHLLDAGGKRFRPLLVLLAAEAGERPRRPRMRCALTAACVVELTHLASLYHDDVMDEADLRRGAESANARWDNHVAILTGDFLFSKSSELTAELGPDALRIQARTFTALVEGQILETLGPGAGEDPLEHYLRVVAGKTGSLIATSARYGARFGGVPLEVEEALTAYGEKVGCRVPALRRHPRRRLRVRGVRQDPRHRPARGRADAAGADRAARRPTPTTPGCSSCSARAADRRRPHAEALGPAPRPSGDGRGPRLRRRAAPPRPRRCSGAAGRPGPRPPSRRSPT